MPDASAFKEGLNPPPPVSFQEALRFWFKLGWISFGGPAGQIAMMQTELVDRKRWIDQHFFLTGLNFCTLLPGPEATQLAIYIGWRLHGLLGGIAAGVLFVLPGAFILFGLSWLAAAKGDTAIVSAVFYGLKPVVIAIVAGAVWRIGSRTLTTWQAVTVAIAAFLSIYVLSIDFPWIVLAAGIIGWLSSLDGRSPFNSGGHGKAAQGGDTAISLAEVAVVQKPMRRLAAYAAAFIALLVLPVGLTLAAFGTQPFLDVANLFTKAAFVTFGGAYAVLPYVADEAVRTYGWLTPDDMLNGLALAETTPGPLILVLQYVGFYAGWNNIVGLDPMLAAIVGSALATYCTFLPSFFFVLAPAPYIHMVHQSPMLASALGAVTAAVVGVVLNLAVFLAEGVVFHNGHVDFFAIALAVVAFAIMLRWKIEIYWLVIGGALAGLAWQTLVA